MNRRFSFKFVLDKNGFYDHKSFPPIINISVSIIHICLIVVGALFVVVFPITWTLVIMPLTIISLLLAIAGVPSFVQNYFPKINANTVVLPTLRFLKEISLLDFFTKLYMVVFYTEAKIFFYFRNFCYGLTIVYMLVSRYYFYHKVVLRDELSFVSITFICLLLFVSFLGSYLRILINVSQLVCIIARCYAPELLDPVVRVEPPEIPPSSHKSLFSFSKHTHNHYHPPQTKGVNWGRFGFFVACGGMIISGATYYHTTLQTAAAQRQTYEFKRQNDLEELAQGLITKEEYQKRHPKN